VHGEGHCTVRAPAQEGLCASGKALKPRLCSRFSALRRLSRNVESIRLLRVPHRELDHPHKPLDGAKPHSAQFSAPAAFSLNSMLVGSCHESRTVRIRDHRTGKNCTLSTPMTTYTESIYLLTAKSYRWILVHIDCRILPPPLPI
jgi:hypothetical protein